MGTVYHTPRDVGVEDELGDTFADAPHGGSRGRSVGVRDLAAVQVTGEVGQVPGINGVAEAARQGVVGSGARKDLRTIDDAGVGRTDPSQRSLAVTHLIGCVKASINGVGDI